MRSSNSIHVVRGTYQSSNRLLQNKIGGDDTEAGSLNHPSGNLWPMALGDYTTLPICAEPGANNLNRYNVACTGSPWTSPANWNSIWNNSGAGITYWRFKNEFLGEFESEDGGVDVDMPLFLLAKTPANGTFTPDAGYTVIEMCTTMPWEDIVFPHTRPAVSSNDMEVSDQPLLGYAFPNPGSTFVSIPFQLSSLTKDAKIQILDLKGGNVLAEKKIDDTKLHECMFNIEQLPAGLYVYRLCIEGIPLANKQLAVAR